MKMLKTWDEIRMKIHLKWDKIKLNLSLAFNFQLFRMGKCLAATIVSE